MILSKVVTIVLEILPFPVLNAPEYGGLCVSMYVWYHASCYLSYLYTDNDVSLGCFNIHAVWISLCSNILVIFADYLCLISSFLVLMGSFQQDQCVCLELSSKTVFTSCLELTVSADLAYIYIATHYIVTLMYFCGYCVSYVYVEHDTIQLTVCFSKFARWTEGFA